MYLCHPSLQCIAFKAVENLFCPYTSIPMYHKLALGSLLIHKIDLRLDQLILISRTNKINKTVLANSRYIYIYIEQNQRT